MKTKLPILKFKDGVVMKHGHLQPHFTIIPQVALETAPVTTDGVVWITCLYRKIRDTLDFHELCAAVDFRCKNIVADDQEAIEFIGHKWAERMSAKLGPDYDVIAHGSGDNFHVHAEFDPR
jgi:hypothetical protein